jgi:hypothetical protein
MSHYSLFISRTVAVFGSVLFVTSICYFGCETRLKEPTLLPPTEVIPKIQQERVGDLSAQQLKHVDEMQGRLKVTHLPGVDKEDYSSQIKHCLSFLVKEFGPPIYRGEVTLRISADPNDNGRMTWSDSRRRYRTITLNELCLYKPSEFRVLVHELFHAFYQTNNFIKGNPDFITEGLAIYAEYKYRYRNKTDQAILKIMREESEALSPSIEYEKINFNTPFQAYGDLKIDLYYILSGRLFYSQDPKTINEKIRSILEKGATFNSRQGFEELIKVYGLRRTESFLKKGTDVAFQMPEAPKQVQEKDKVSGRNTIGQEKSMQVSRQSATKQPYVQIAYYSKEKKSIGESNAKKYKSRGFSAHVIKHPQKPGWILVLGPYPNRREAEKVKQELIRNDPAAPEGIFVEDF